jgi:hypothetical protein
LVVPVESVTHAQVSPWRSDHTLTATPQEMAVTPSDPYVHPSAPAASTVQPQTKSASDATTENLVDKPKHKHGIKPIFTESELHGFKDL